MDTEQQRAAARELARQAWSVPAIGRLRELVAFVGAGREATQAGKLDVREQARGIQRFAFVAVLASLSAAAGRPHICRRFVAS